MFVPLLSIFLIDLVIARLVFAFNIIANIFGPNSINTSRSKPSGSTAHIRCAITTQQTKWISPLCMNRGIWNATYDYEIGQRRHQVEMRNLVCVKFGNINWSKLIKWNSTYVRLTAWEKVFVIASHSGVLVKMVLSANIPSWVSSCFLALSSAHASYWQQCPTN